jgi:hypothetical protein
VIGPLNRADQLARQHLTGDEQKETLEEIGRLRDVLGVTNMIGNAFGPGMFNEIFERVGVADEDDFDED